jgi:bifunctional ADP-heptose synthase (sugar kinase/adenylyltransferase)
LAKSLLNKTSAGNILLKLGEEGILVHPGKVNSKNEVTDRIGALNDSPKDVAGAGDSLLVSSSLALLCGSNIWEASYIGSIAAAIQVGRVGNTPLQFKEILNQIK